MSISGSSGRALERRLSGAERSRAGVKVGVLGTLMAAVVVAVSFTGGSTSRVSAAADPSSPDCVYAVGILSAGADVAFNIVPRDLDQKGQVDSYQKALQSATAAVNQLQPPDGLQQFQLDLLGIMNGFSQQAQDAQTALAAGDGTKAADFLSQMASFDPVAKTLQPKYPQETQRLGACIGG